MRNLDWEMLKIARAVLERDGASALHVMREVFDKVHREGFDEGYLAATHDAVAAGQIDALKADQQTEETP